MDKEADSKSGWRRKLLTVPGVLGTTALTALVGAGVTWTVNYLREAEFHPSDAIKLSVETDPAKMSGVNTYLRPVIIPSTVRTHGAPTERQAVGCEGFHAWAADNHGVDAGETLVQIAAQGTSDKPVLIQNMRVRITDTSPPMNGIAAECQSQGLAERRGIAVDLDATPPTVDYKSDPSAPFGFTLAKGESELFMVSATAAKATYRWKIYFDVVVNGATDTLEVGGKDGFITTVAPAQDAMWEWDYVDSYWIRIEGNRIVDRIPPSESLPAPK